MNAELKECRSKKFLSQLTAVRALRFFGVAYWDRICGQQMIRPGQGLDEIKEWVDDRSNPIAVRGRGRLHDFGATVELLAGEAHSHGTRRQLVSGCASPRHSGAAALWADINAGEFVANQQEP
jgi:hypothetical protein